MPEIAGRLIAVRHGCSTWNAAGRFTGSADVDLAPEGRHEALAAGLTLKRAGVAPARLVTSNLRRARQTAEIIARVCDWSVGLVETPDLDERDHGVLEGLTLAEAEERFGRGPVRAWRRTDLGGPPAGESFDQVLVRVRRAWSRSVAPALAADQLVVVVAHGTSLRCLLVAAGLSTEQASSFEVPRARPALISRPGGRWEPLISGAGALGG